MTNRLNLGCGEDIRAGWVNADVVALDGVDVVFDIDTTPWPFDDNTFVHIEASHVFEHLQNVDQALHEAARVLESGGTLTLRLPIRMNYRSDDTHKNEWTWNTPTNKLQNHWEPEFALTLRDRSVELHSWAPWPLYPLQRVKFAVLNRYMPDGPWAWRVPGPTFGPYGGEFTVTFKHP